jgi:ribosomal protein L37AE/L43A
MVSQRCPRCASERVRRGYRPTPIWSKVLFRYNLLCDNCNWEFTGFAVPGTVSTKPTKKPKKSQFIEKEETAGKDSTQSVIVENAAEATNAKRKKKESKSDFKR